MKIKPGPLFRDKFFGAPYKFDGQSKEEGFDCLSFVDHYYKEMGKIFPDISDLYHMYDESHEARREGFRQIWDRVSEVTDEISIGNMQVGDLVILYVDNFGKCPSIYFGNGMIGVCSVEKGVGVSKLKDFNVLQVRRLK